MSDILTTTAVSFSKSMQPQVKAQRKVHIRAIVEQVMTHWELFGDLKVSMETVSTSLQSRVAEAQVPLDDDYVEAVKDVAHVFQLLTPEL